MFCLIYQSSNFISLQSVFQIIANFHCSANFFRCPLELIATDTHGAQRSVFVTSNQQYLDGNAKDRYCKEQFAGR